jgi:AcrR family transcriptional regulator
MDVATRVFARKGFDGARVDEIAKEAGIPKSLIYYHFKGKDHLLEELLSRFFSRYDQVLRIEDKVINGKSKYISFLDENADLLRVVLIESLKKDSNITNSIFKSVEQLLSYEHERQGEKEKSEEERHKRLVIEFFTNQLPGDAIDKTHGAYHKSAE